MLELKELTTKDSWTQFEASILTVGLFTKLPISIVNEHSDTYPMILLWRGVLDQTLFDLLRGPLVDCRPPPKRNPRGLPSKAYLKKLKHWNEVCVREANKVHRDAIHWLYGGKTIYEWLDTEDKLLETNSDFIQVCELAAIEPDLVKSTIIKLLTLKEKTLNQWVE